MINYKNLMRCLSVGICLLFLAKNAHAQQQWNPNHLIGTATRVYNYAYNQTPAQLGEIYPAGIPNTGFTYQWYSSSSPVTGFAMISGATAATYSPPALNVNSVTMYYYRVTTSASLGSITSNTVKINVVSVGWEDINYVREHDVKTTGVINWTAVDQLVTGSKIQTTNYFDGVGRSLQNVSKQTATPPNGVGTWGDLVQFSAYDVANRQPKKYLPYTTTNQSGLYKTAPVTDEAAYYSNATTYNETSAFTQITYETNPLNRLSNVKESGAKWAASVGISITYDMNSASENVQNFSISYTQASSPISLGAYSSNALLRSVYKDVNGNQIIEYVNKSGQLILKKVQAVSVPSIAHDGWLCTYSIYDDFGQLRYQIQPEGVKYLDTHSWSFGGTDGTTILNEQVFQYYFDDKGRTTWKKAPGANPIIMFYDSRDRLVFTQDGNQAAMATDQYTVNLFDELDRPIAATLFTNTTHKLPADLQADIAAAAPLASGTINISGLPLITLSLSYCPISFSNLNNTSITSFVKFLFYDNYSYPLVKSFNTSYTNLNAYSTADPNVDAISKSLRTVDLTTGQIVRILGTNVFLTSTYYFDEKGRANQTITDNIKSGTDITTLQYHFDGRLLSSCNSHTNASAGYTSYITLDKYNFDVIGRLISLQKQLGSNPLKNIASYDYDDLGRIKIKHLDPGYNNITTGLSELESLVYTYNIHNQVTGINKDYASKNPGMYNKWGHYFGLYIGYDNKDNAFTAAQLNGQVTGLMWNTQGDDAQRMYNYSYDNAGRLTLADFSEQKHLGDGWSKSSMDFTVSGVSGKITYDNNGNLLTMQQKGVIPGTSSPITIDDLRYSYNDFSNKLKNVTDMMTLTAQNGKFEDFKDGANAAGTADYVFDQNGNIVVDLNKNLQSLNNGAAGTPGVHFNFLDKADQIRIVGKGTVVIVYDANGNKLQRAYIPEAGGASTVTTYINQFVYQESATLTVSSPAPFSGTGIHLAYINFEEGRIRAVTTTSTNNGFDAMSETGNIVLPGTNQTGAWDYFIMDYQKSVRMILTEEIHSAMNVCTMETTSSRPAAEDPVFGQTGGSNEVESTRFAKPVGWTGNGTLSVSHLGVLSGHILGPNTLQKVMAGDRITAQADYYYQSTTGGNSPNLPTALLGNLLSLIGNGAATVGSLTHNAGTAITTNLNSTPGFIPEITPTGVGGTVPQAYLTILFFDERFNFIPLADGGVYQKQVDVNITPAGLQLTQVNIPAPKNGYVYIYLSNRSDQDVFFDNFKVTINTGNLIEENHYYAFGMKITGICSKKLGDAGEGKLSNPHQYNDKEMLDEDMGLNWSDYGFRTYDPQIGRFTQLDPLTDKYPFLTPFQYASNDPIANIDIDGLEGASPLGSVASASEEVFRGGQVSNLAAVVITPVRAAKPVTVGSKVIQSSTSILVMSFKVGTDLINTSFESKLPKIIARSNNRMEREDMQEGDGDASTLGKDGEFYARSGDGVALSAMKYEIENGTRFANSKMSRVARQMYEQFKSKKGGDFRSKDLDDEVKNDPRYLEFIQQFKVKFEGALAENGGDINALLNSSIDLTFIVPTFHDYTTGLGITVDAINYTCIGIKKFNITPQGNYRAEIKVYMFDSFGLDTKDVQGFGSGNIFKRVGFKLGFVAWWILQHVKGYKHLNTKIFNEEVIEGTIK